jgi:hypothetical protein
MAENLTRARKPNCSHFYQTNIVELVVKMRRVYLFLIVLLIIGLGYATLWLWSELTTRPELNLFSIVEFIIPISLISNASLASILWLFGSAIMGLLGIIFSKVSSKPLNSKRFSQ